MQAMQICRSKDVTGMTLIFQKTPVIVICDPKDMPVAVMGMIGVCNIAGERLPNEEKLSYRILVMWGEG